MKFLNFAILLLSIIGMFISNGVEATVTHPSCSPGPNHTQCMRGLMHEQGQRSDSRMR